MIAYPRQTLDAQQAARIVYSTDEPNSLQVREIERRLERGVIKGTKPNRAKPCWTTTADSIADYMAAGEYRKRLRAGTLRRASGIDKRKAQPGRKTFAAHPAEARQLQKVYQELFKDYFLAMIFRKRRRRADRPFQRAVIAGQIAILVLIATSVGFAVRPFFSGQPPEQAAIERWLDDNVGDYQVARWFPPQADPHGDGTAIRVQFRYSTPGGKGVYSERMFIIREGRVVSADSDW